MKYFILLHFFHTSLFDLGVETPFLICFSEQVISRASVSRKYRKKNVLNCSWKTTVSELSNVPLVFALFPEHALCKTLSNKNNLDVKVTDKYLSMTTAVTLETQQGFYSHPSHFYVWRFPCVATGNHWEAPWRARWVSLKESKSAFELLLFFLLVLGFFFFWVRKLLREYGKRGNFNFFSADTGV